MFSNSKKSNKKSNHSQKMPAINMISEETIIEGKLESNIDIRIAGYINGDAKSGGKFMLTSTGKVTGNIYAKNADIAGKVEGELHVEDKLILRKSAKIKGDLHTQTLLVEEGATFDGACMMNSKENKVQTEHNPSNGTSGKKISAKKKASLNK